MEVVIPVVDGIQQRDGGDDRGGHGTDDGNQYSQISRAVDAGGFLDGLRQALKIVLDDEHIELDDGEGQNQRRVGIQNTQHLNHHVGRHDAAEEHHGEHIQQRHRTAVFERGLRQGVGGADADHHGNEGADDGNNQGVFQRGKELRLKQNVADGFQLEPSGPEPDRALSYICALAEGLTDHVQARQDRDQRENGHQNIREARYEFFAGIQSDALMLSFFQNFFRHNGNLLTKCFCPVSSC